MPVATYAYDCLKSNDIVVDGVQYHRNTSACHSNHCSRRHRPAPGNPHTDPYTDAYTDPYTDPYTHGYAH